MACQLLIEIYFNFWIMYNVIRRKKIEVKYSNSNHSSL